jgi:mRNA-degrading endonuclease RelE of RelBE toxin-antitoxin system
MKYRVEFSKLALKELKKTDKNDVALLIGWIKKDL